MRGHGIIPCVGDRFAGWLIRETDFDDFAGKIIVIATGGPELITVL